MKLVVVTVVVSVVEVAGVVDEVTVGPVTATVVVEKIGFWITIGR